MKTLSRIVLSCCLALSLFSCTKEATADPVVPAPAVDSTSKIVGAWKGKYLEQELYVNNVMTSKKVITSTRNAIEFRKDSSYTSVFESDMPESGTWELITPTYLRLDKGKVTDRYYHIITLDNKNLVYRGPFDVSGNVKFNYLITVYNFK